jgi:hypothetical protein
MVLHLKRVSKYITKNFYKIGPWGQSDKTFLLFKSSLFSCKLQHFALVYFFFASAKMAFLSKRVSKFTKETDFVGFAFGVNLIKLFSVNFLTLFL